MTDFVKPLLSSVDFRALVDSIQVRVADPLAHHTEVGVIGLGANPDLFHQIVRENGLDSSKLLGKRFVSMYVPISAALWETLEYRVGAVYGVKPDGLVSRFIHLEVLKNNRVLAKYQSIIGSWFVAELSDEDMAYFMAKYTDILKTQAAA